ncbi:hypothetical protein Ddc_13123 [Ditylenchus destructor]|nr:hypothetical protein Ddc_13123 [Ditylenchus destructor]
MRRSTRLAQKRTGLENDAQMGPTVKKRRLEKKISMNATMDNGTMVEAFKYLNYMQLAKSSLVSKRYSNLIRTNRHSLALLSVDSIDMSEYIGEYSPARPAGRMKLYNKKISTKEYNEWIIHNRYSKRIPLNGQVEYGSQVYDMTAEYKDSNETTWVFAANGKLNHEKWPLFQHFVRLLTDPFIYVRSLTLTPRIDVSFINLLAEAMNPDYNRLKCDEFVLFSKLDNRKDNVLKFIGSTKNYVYCNKFQICLYSDSNYDEEFLDLFVTGAHCSSAIEINLYDISNVFKALLQKFMGLESSDEYKIVESIRGQVKDGRIAEELKRNYAKFIAEEADEEGSGTSQVIGFINKDIAKKLTLSVKKFSHIYFSSTFSIKITNL